MATYEAKIRFTSEHVAGLYALESQGLKILQQWNTDDAPPAAATPPKKRKHYAGGKRDKGISALEFFLNVIKNGPKSETEIEREFVRRGFSATTVAPTASKLSVAGRIRQPKRYYYELVPPAPNGKML